MQLAEGEETARRADLERHSRKCTICRHPDRDAIEHDFLHWCHPVDIAEQFGLADHSSIYRHAHATGLFARRRQSICIALEPLLEHVHTIDVTAATVISAVRLYAQLNGESDRVRPAKTVIVHHITHPAATVSQPESENPNRQIQELEDGPTN
jgi:hypothetical protein